MNPNSTEYCFRQEFYITQPRRNGTISPTDYIKKVNVENKYKANLVAKQWFGQEPEPNKCTHCGKFVTPTNQPKHCEQELNQKRWKCTFKDVRTEPYKAKNICGARFNSKTRCKTHIENQHFNAPKRFRCCVCGKRFTRKWNAKNHPKTPACQRNRQRQITH